MNTQGFLQKFCISHLKRRQLGEARDYRSLDEACKPPSRKFVNSWVMDVTSIFLRWGCMRLCPTFWPLPNENFVEDTVDMDTSDYALCVRASWTDIYN